MQRAFKQSSLHRLPTAKIEKGQASANQLSVCNLTFVVVLRVVRTRDTTFPDSPSSGSGAFRCYALANGLSQEALRARSEKLPWMAIKTPGRVATSKSNSARQQTNALKTQRAGTSYLLGAFCFAAADKDLLALHSNLHKQHSFSFFSHGAGSNSSIPRSTKAVPIQRCSTRVKCQQGGTGRYRLLE